MKNRNQTEEEKTKILQKFNLIINERGNSWKSFMSLMNYNKRSLLGSSQDLGFKVKAGDICYVDFGLAYKYECGFQHMALVITISNYKALVVPMTSNESAYKKANEGSPFLLNFPKHGNLAKNSTLFLNDMKYINTARVIEIITNIETDTELFQQIRSELIKLI